MNAFRDIDALLRVIAREKEILKFLFTGRKAPSLRQEEALENFLGRDERRLGLLLEHGVVRLAEGFLVLEDTYLHKNAYAKWSREDDSTLLAMYNAGGSVKAIAIFFGRNEGAIRSRMKKITERTLSLWK